MSSRLGYASPSGHGWTQPFYETVGGAAIGGRSMPVIPFRIEDVRPSGPLALHLARRHWLDALTAPLEQHLERLADAAEHLLARYCEKPMPGDASISEAVGATAPRVEAAPPPRVEQPEPAQAPAAQEPAQPQQPPSQKAGLWRWLLTPQPLPAWAVRASRWLRTPWSLTEAVAVTVVAGLATLLVLFVLASRQETEAQAEARAKQHFGSGDKLYREAISHLSRGELGPARQDFEEAALEFRKALELKPHSEGSRGRLEDCQRQLRQLQESSGPRPTSSGGG